MKLVLASILLVACSSDPLEPGAGDDPGTGTNSLLVDGSVSASPRFANATSYNDYDTDFSISVSLNGTRVDTGSVRITTLRTAVELAWDNNGGQFGNWRGTLAGYDEVYRLDIVYGPDRVERLIVDGPDIAVITAPVAGASLDSTVANTVKWSRDDEADLITIRADGSDRVTITDSGTYALAPGSLDAHRDQARTNTLELRRTNNVAPAGAFGGSTFSVTVDQELEVVALPNPAL
jgi:hypothetical protein